ncbi:hypothetical protein [Brevibacterium sp. K72]|uniref:hypothetical protein n=1 Tax=Brevibacterium sp. K72 TaxID=3390729 RepID=UPI003D2FE57E
MDLNNDRLTPAAQATLDEIVTNYRDRILEILLKSDLKRIGPPDVLRVEEVGRNSATLANLLELSTSFQDTNFRRMRRYSLMLLSISVFQAVIAVGLTAAYYLGGVIASKQHSRSAGV